MDNPDELTKQGRKDKKLLTWGGEFLRHHVLLHTHTQRERPTYN